MAAFQHAILERLNDAVTAAVEGNADLAQRVTRHWREQARGHGTGRKRPAKLFPAPTQPPTLTGTAEGSARMFWQVAVSVPLQPTPMPSTGVHVPGPLHVHVARGEAPPAASPGLTSAILAALRSHVSLRQAVVPSRAPPAL